MKKWNLIIDVEKCEDCNNCFLACKDEHVDNDWSGYTISQPLHGQRWINIMRKERGQYPLIDVAYLPVPCMHCDSPPCVKAGENKAVYKRDDGIVIIDPIKAKGQEAIVKSCPYNAIWWNEEKKIPQKCTMCAHLLDDGWSKTRCVQACPTGALSLIKVDDSDMSRILEVEQLEALYSEKNTKPRVWYKNLYRYEKCFISGSVAFNNGEVIDCAEGSSVIVLKDSNTVKETVTDNYGDFKFDRLDENSGHYTLKIRFRDNAERVIELDLTKSLNTGTIMV